MKKSIYSLAAIAGVVSAGWANIPEISGFGLDVVNSNTKDECVTHEVVGTCSGNILILDRSGKVVNTISFSAPKATSLQECVGLYYVAVYELSLSLKQGETTGGTVDFR
ncbi:hypothetical protein CHU92_00180 [Flavobacterium cyanobacteriorum]|uniref:Uncharacterized protein n=1 Tax=Flavobacterium cyanobacteriorum TaxID=2022802 RepID=A0A256A8J4_9FLAO|nr:hypothetical protein [Flavobacterium cyanobacteriorum]OYQ50032.1 hypothetical protein CHU92_00180 [Flavobacterium cyanobacteriorum]